MPMVSLASIILVLVTLVAFLAIRDYQRRRGLPYPPGPRPLPLIGNLLDIPKEFSWLTYTELSKKHGMIYIAGNGLLTEQTTGDVLSFHVFGKVIVVLNSIKATKDLLESRSDIYSDRPAMPIFDMMKWKWIVSFSNYTESCRLVRKLLNRGLRPANIAMYRPLLQTKAYILLAQVLASPDELDAHLYHMSGSIILAMGYGYEAKEHNDRKVNVAKDLLQLIGEVFLPGALLVNDLPFLRYVPEWLPRFSYKPLFRYGCDIGQEVLHGPMEFVRESILDGTAQPSLALENLQETEKLEEPERKKAEEVITRALGSMYLGGTESTASSAMAFFVAALVRPEIQAIAQKELDAVTKRGRLPTFEDRPRLPYVDAISKEMIRWRPVGPLGLPHSTAEDDVYNRFFIPKSAIMMVNVWAILHNPDMYPEPDSFKPERFINPDGSLREDPVLTSLFGFGKRLCPGRHLADATLFIVVASVLSVFDVKKGKDTDGGPDAYPFTGGGLSIPCPFAYSIKPRDRRAEELITASAQAQ